MRLFLNLYTKLHSEYAAVLFHRKAKLLSRQTVRIALVDPEIKLSYLKKKTGVRLFVASIFTGNFSKLKIQSLKSTFKSTHKPSN